MPTFTEVPEDNRSPAAFVEIDDSQAGAGTGSIKHVLVIGHKESAAGAVAVNVLTDLTTVAEADAAFGARSQLRAMVKALLDANDQLVMHTIACSAGGSAATGDFTLGGAATEDGSIEIWVGDKKFLVPVSNGDSPTVMGQAMDTVLVAAPNIPVTSGEAVGVVTLTAAWAGPTGKETLLTVGTLPAGVTCVATQMTGGGAVPDLAAAVAVFDSDPYDIVAGVADTAALDLLETEVSTRWQAGSILGGHIYGALSGNRSTVAAFGVLRNAPQATLMGTLDSTSQPWLWAATLAAVDLLASVGASRYQLELPGLVPPAPALRAQTNGQRNLLLKQGISTYLVSGGKVLVDRLATTYQRDVSSNPDKTWFSLRTRQVVWFLRQDWRARSQKAFVGKLIADDGTLISAGSGISTPSAIKAEAVAWARDMERLGLIEKVDVFKSKLSVVRTAGDAERVDALITPDLVNELVTLATSLAFRI